MKHFRQVQAQETNPGNMVKDVIDTAWKATPLGPAADAAKDPLPEGPYNNGLTKQDQGLASGLEWNEAERQSKAELLSLGVSEDDAMMMLSQLRTLGAEWSTYPTILNAITSLASHADPKEAFVLVYATLKKVRSVELMTSMVAHAKDAAQKYGMGTLSILAHAAMGENIPEAYKKAASIDTLNIMKGDKSENTLARLVMYFARPDNAQDAYYQNLREEMINANQSTMDLTQINEMAKNVARSGRFQGIIEKYRELAKGAAAKYGSPQFRAWHEFFLKDLAITNTSLRTMNENIFSGNKPGLKTTPGLGFDRKSQRLAQMKDLRPPKPATPTAPIGATPVPAAGVYAPAAGATAPATTSPTGSWTKYEQGAQAVNNAPVASNADLITILESSSQYQKLTQQLRSMIETRTMLRESLDQAFEVLQKSITPDSNNFFAGAMTSEGTQSYTLATPEQITSEANRVAGMAEELRSVIEQINASLRNAFSSGLPPQWIAAASRFNAQQDAEHRRADEVQLLAVELANTGPMLQQISLMMPEYSQIDQQMSLANTFNRVGLLPLARVKAQMAFKMANLHIQCANAMSALQSQVGNNPAVMQRFGQIAQWHMTHAEKRNVEGHKAVADATMGLFGGNFSQLQGAAVARTQPKFIKMAEAGYVGNYYDELYEDSEGSPNYGTIMESPEEFRNETSEGQPVSRFKKRMSEPDPIVLSELP